MRERTGGPRSIAWPLLALGALALAARADEVTATRSERVTAPLPQALAAAASGIQAAAPDPGENAGSIVAASGTAGADSAAQAAPAESPAGAEPPPPLWLETYGEGVYSRQEDDNLAGFTDWKIGKRLPGPLKADVYAKIRVYRDQGGFYWNNRADGGFGARVPLLRKISLSLFTEATWGRYLSMSSGVVPLDRMQSRIDRNRDAIDAAQKQFQAMYKAIFEANVLQDPSIDRQTLNSLDTLGNAQLAALARLNGKLDSLETAKDSLRQAMDSIALVPSGEVTEYKLGLVFWQAWGGPPDDADPPTVWFGFPLRPWGEVYADCIGSMLTRHVQVRDAAGEYVDVARHINDLILYSNPCIGWLVMEGQAGSIAAFASLYGWVDTRGDWWNNRAMAGPGVRYQPFRELDLTVRAEYLWGSFFGRERKSDPNPYRQRFTDTRLTASFWHGLGI